MITTIIDCDGDDGPLIPTKHCTRCRPTFDVNQQSVYPMLEKRGKFWCCPNCDGSYGENPHPDCK